MSYLSKIKVSVTAEDIKNGRPESHISCPIALALARKGIFASVDYEHATIGEHLYELPESASVFVERFDEGKKVEPFEFEMDVVAEAPANPFDEETIS